MPEITMPDEFIDLADDCGVYNFIPGPIGETFIDLTNAFVNNTPDDYLLRDYHKTATILHNVHRTDIEYDADGAPVLPIDPTHPAMHPGAATSFQLQHADSGRIFRVTIEHISN